MGTESSNAGQQAILRLLEDARKKLVETGTKNRLVHINRANTRANALNIVDEKSDAVFEFLYRKNRKMRFYAQGKDVDSEDSDSPKLAIIEEALEFDESRYYDNQLETRLSPDKLQKRLLKLNKDAAVAEQEQGINILFLALGFMTWYEDKSSAVKREAPLILLPVELVRNSNTATYELQVRDDDLVTNLPLQQRMQQDFGIEIPELEIEEDWTPSKYFGLLRERISNKENWSIDEDGMQLGFFSFAKLLMLRDLDPGNWKDRGLENNPLIQGLLQSGEFRDEPPLFQDGVNLDTVLDPINIIQVVDADASQTKVIEEVRSGRNLVVQGPPGTGKSQTITNILAAAAYDGKRVLFMAEKLAALNVVHDKLLKNGLQDICLELHSRSANKKAVMAELQSTLYWASNLPEKPELPHELTKLRDELNHITTRLHTPFEDTGESPFDVMGTQAKLIGLGVPAPQVSVGSTATIPKSEFEKLVSSVRSYALDVSSYGSLDKHPLFGVENLELQPLDRKRLEEKIPETIQALNRLNSMAEKASYNLNRGLKLSISSVESLLALAEASKLMPATDTEILLRMLENGVSDRMLEGLTSGAELQKRKRSEAEKFIESAWDFDVTTIHVAISSGQNSFWTRLGSRYRHASKDLAGLLSIQLPKSPVHRLRLLDKLAQVQKLARELKDDEEYLSRVFGEEWRGERTSFESLLRSAKWVKQISKLSSEFEPAQTLDFSVFAKRESALFKVLADTTKEAQYAVAESFKVLEADVSALFESDDITKLPITSINSFLTRVLENIDKYAEWVKTKRIQSILVSSDLAGLKEKIDSGVFDQDTAENEIRFARAEATWKSIVARSPLPEKAFERPAIVSAYQEKARARLEETREQIKYKHLSQVPKGAEGQMGVIRSEMAKKIRHLPIRQLMERAGEVIQRIKPVFLMSPVSVSQFLPPETVEFDLLVIDEASQVRPEDALGAIARSKQIVVVGDKKQMPPSAFFDRMTSNEYDGEIEDTGGAAKATELESILTLCEARGLGGLPRMLEWHYRSKDPSLIQVSNDEFYDGKLILPPSPLQDDDSYGLSFVQVPGVYKRGTKNNINTIEAQELIEAVCRHAREAPEYSLGIATFSVVQRNHINELLEHRRRSDSVLDDFLREDKSEDIFVKNLENVQGDERDVIFITVGYGPTVAGGSLTSMSFGPVNSDGGERRLNVLFTRARLRCVVFCSFNPAEIDLNRTKAAGARILKRFLEYAKSGELDNHYATGRGPDTDFEEDVAREIRRLGYRVEYQVGSQGFRIDLGVKHLKFDSQFICAVECDGATYHSALWARERDRLRQEVLEHHGWKFHRIWSTDWFNNRQNEIERLRAALSQAMEDSDRGVEVVGSNRGDGVSNSDSVFSADAEDLPIENFDLPTRELPKYKKFEIEQRIHSFEPHEYPSFKLSQLATRIVEVEGPIHHQEVARRIADCFGKKKAGSRIVDAAYSALRQSTEIEMTDGFCSLKGATESPVVRDRSEQTGSIVKGEMIPPEEIRMAKQYSIEDNGHLETDELVRAIAKMLGYKRVGPDLHTAISKWID